MTPAPTVLMLNRRPAKALQQHVAQLQSHGYTVIVRTELQPLCEMAAQYAVQATTPWIVLLASSLAVNCMAARCLRGLFPSAGILALVASGKESILTLTLHSGADSYCPYRASTALLMASLRPLIARAAIGGQPAPVNVAAADVPGAQGSWALIERGWVLAGPQQQRIALTTGERAFLSALFAAPGLRVNHARLIDAINGSGAHNFQPDHQARLSMLVSRLRRKFRAHGSEAPLRSVHRWGYMFTAPAKGRPLSDALLPVAMYR